MKSRPPVLPRRCDGATLLLERELSEWLPHGRKIYSVLRPDPAVPVAVDFLIASGPDVLRVGWELAELLGLPFDEARQGIPLAPGQLPREIIRQVAEYLHRRPDALEHVAL